MLVAKRCAGINLRAQNVNRRGREANTLIVVLILLAILAILAAMLLPALMRARQQAARARCKSHFKAVGLALHMYAGDYNERFPESLKQVAELGYLFDEEALYCPSVKARTPGEIDYVYIKGLSLNSRPNEPIAFDKKGNHPRGRNVLFVDGHVQWMNEATFQTKFGHLER